MRDFLPWIIGINPTARIDLSAISPEITNLSATEILDHVKALDPQIEFHKNRRGVVSARRDKHNVDDEKNYVYRYVLDRHEKAYWGYQTEYPAKLDGYRGNNVYPYFKKIYSKLENHRGGTIITKQNNLGKCDIFIPGELRIIELDERQHFSALRAVSLENYPTELKTAFDRDEYAIFCKILNSKDDDKKKPYRDEQRAWFDTLRDFMPLINDKFKPIIRVPLFRNKKVDLKLDENAIMTRLEDGFRQ